MYADFVRAMPAVDPWRAPLLPTSGPHNAPLPNRPILGCAAGSMVRTAEGDRRIDTLTPGTLLTTRGGPPVRLCAIHALHLTRAELHQGPRRAPIRFDPGALAEQTSDAAVLLSPDCPVYMTPDADSALGATFPAAAFCNGGTVRHVIPDDGITYIQLHLSDPAEICVGGLWIRLDLEAPAATGDAPASATRPSDRREFIPLAG